MRWPVRSEIRDRGFWLSADRDGGAAPGESGCKGLRRVGRDLRRRGHGRRAHRPAAPPLPDREHPREQLPPARTRRTPERPPATTRPTPWQTPAEGGDGALRLALSPRPECAISIAIFVQREIVIDTPHGSELDVATKRSVRISGQQATLSRRNFPFARWNRKAPVRGW